MCVCVCVCVCVRVCVCVCVCVMRVSRRFCQRESNIEVLYIFLADEKREDQNATISGTHRPAREKNDVLMACR